MVAGQRRAMLFSILARGWTHPMVRREAPRPAFSIVAASPHRLLLQGGDRATLQTWSAAHYGKPGSAAPHCSL